MSPDLPATPENHPESVRLLASTLRTLDEAHRRYRLHAAKVIGMGHTELSALVAAVLAPDGLVVSESDRRDPLDLPDLPLQDERRYGDTLIRLHAHH